jgi:hypothetical protein
MSVQTKSVLNQDEDLVVIVFEDYQLRTLVWQSKEAEKVFTAKRVDNDTHLTDVSLFLRSEKAWGVILKYGE